MVETHRLIVDRHEDDLVVVARGRPGPQINDKRLLRREERRGEAEEAEGDCDSVHDRPISFCWSALTSGALNCMRAASS